MAHDDEDFTIGDDPEEYEISGRILLIAIIILFALVTFILLLNLLARWRVVVAHRRELRRRNRVNQRTQLFYYVNNNRPGVATPSRGLGQEVLNSIPIFVYDSTMEEMECSVCLSVFEDDDKGRVLPKCGHYFHAECVDMWFHSHSTCPLCRSKVELIQEQVSNRPLMSPPLKLHGNTVGDSRSRRAIAMSYRSPMKDSDESRRLSLKRLLSMNKKNPADVNTSCGVQTSDNHPMGIETDLESGLA